MVRLWAEKEMRNLKRLIGAGIHCPEPVEVRENVLVMGFLGDKEGWYVYITVSLNESVIIDSFHDRASPRLKDAQIPSSSYPALYQELILSVRKMYHQCKLIHADLSEYNILYHENHLFIIDVSQSVEQDHPNAFDFLRKDLKNIEEFFGRFGVGCLGLRRCFEFVTRERIVEGDDDDEGAVLQKWLAEEKKPEENDDLNNTQADLETSAHEDSVFLQSYIPRTLNEVYDPERDVEALKKDGTKGLIYSKTIGLVESTGNRNGELYFGKDQQGEYASEEDDDIEESEGDDEGEDGDGRVFEDRQPRGHRHEDKEAKKVRLIMLSIIRVNIFFRLSLGA